MQCLSSPTRQDIDKAHRQRIWLDNGTPSMKNLFRISRLRMVQCWLIAISSLPLHLMYNSAVFTTLFDREYNAFLVSLIFSLALHSMSVQYSLDPTLIGLIVKIRQP